MQEVLKSFANVKSELEASKTLLFSQGCLLDEKEYQARLCTTCCVTYLKLGSAWQRAPPTEPSRLCGALQIEALQMQNVDLTADLTTCKVSRLHPLLPSQQVFRTYDVCCFLALKAFQH